jgi:hypothetical protein
MTKKHLIELAMRYSHCLKWDEIDRSTAVKIIIETADVLARSNPRFDRGRFLASSGLSPSERGSYSQCDN